MFTFLFKHKPTGRLIHVLAEDLDRGTETAAMIVEEKGIHEISDEKLGLLESVSVLSHEVGADAREIDRSKLKRSE